MRAYGDIPEKHLIIVKDLIKMENFFHQEKDQIRPIMRAKGLLCMAHDYYMMYMEEEAERLLGIAIEHSPGYFRGPIYDHMKTDAEFHQIVYELENTDAILLMKKFGYRE